MTIVSIAQLEYDDVDIKDCAHYPAMRRIMTAIPVMLDVLKKSIAWKESGIIDYDHIESYELARALMDCEG